MLARKLQLSLLYAVSLTACRGIIELEENTTDSTTTLTTLSTETTVTTETTGTTGTSTTTFTTTFTGDIVISDVAWSLNSDYDSIIHVTWAQSAVTDGWVEFAVDDGIWRTTPVGAFGAGQGEATLLGVPYDWSVEFRVVLEADGVTTTSESFTATTGPVPENGAVPTLLASDASQWSEDMQYFLMSDSSDFTAILDRQLRVVWMHPGDWAGGPLMPRVSADGEYILIDYNTYWWSWDGGDASYVIKEKIDGSEYEEIDTPGAHHPFTDMPDGTIIYGQADNYTEDLIDIDGGLRTIWECEDFVDEFGGGSYCQSNTIWYNEPTDSIFFSLFSNETIVEIDRKTGDTLRHFGHSDGAWSFDPPSSAFYWQHGVNILENGNLLTSSQASSNSTVCVVREYEMDYDTRTLRQVWSFGEGEGVRSDEMGEAHRLSNGNTLHNFGSGARMREITQDGEVVWDLDWGNGGLGRTTPIADLYELL